MLANILPTLENETSNYRRSAYIDAKSYLARCRGDVRFALILLDEFTNSVQHQVDQLTLLSVDNKLAEAAEVAHALKGAAAIVGAEEIRARAAEIEEAGRSERPVQLFALVGCLREEMTSCLNSLPQLHSQLQEM